MSRKRPAPASAGSSSSTEGFASEEEDFKGIDAADSEGVESLEDSEEDEFEEEQATARQYVGESDLEDPSEDGREPQAGPSLLPFGEQMKQQKKARRGQTSSAPLPEEADGPTSLSILGRRGRSVPRHAVLPGVKTTSRPSTKPPLPHRSDKHAPTIQSSKRPVPRFRSVLATDDAPRVWDPSKARDPRFDTLSGAVDPDLVKRSYGFLEGQRGKELKDMKEALDRAKKGKKGGGGQATREETERLEKAVRRLENQEVERKRKNRDEQVRRKWKKEEQGKREQGKPSFYLKKKEEKKMLLEERYRDLSSDKRRLHKSLDRKRKKESARGKKSKPPPRAFPS